MNPFVALRKAKPNRRTCQPAVLDDAGSFVRPWTLSRGSPRYNGFHRTNHPGASDQQIAAIDAGAQSSGHARLHSADPDNHDLKSVAAFTHSVASEVFDVPNEPLTFRGDQFASRSEG